MNNLIGETVVYCGKIFEVIQQKRNINGKEVIYELARRSPGIRLIIIKENKMLITKEYRSELNNYDYRLPGGKVFDTLKEYTQALNSKENILTYAQEAAKKECIEETGLHPTQINFYETTKAGATVEWDLFYFIVDKFEEGTQELEEGEDIAVSWKSFDEVKKMCLSNLIKEDRTVGVLLKFLDSSK
ncbi:MAG: NUDIX domain-containing protein [Candidatus Nanoarchaeia archaeon]